MLKYQATRAASITPRRRTSLSFVTFHLPFFPPLCCWTDLSRSNQSYAEKARRAQRELAGFSLAKPASLERRSRFSRECVKRTVFHPFTAINYISLSGHEIAGTREGGGRGSQNLPVSPSLGKNNFSRFLFLFLSFFFCCTGRVCVRE